MFCKIKKIWKFYNMTGIYFKLAGMGCYSSENIINLSHVRDLRDTCCKCIV